MSLGRVDLARFSAPLEPLREQDSRVLALQPWALHRTVVPGACITRLSLSNAASGVAPRETRTGKSVHLDLHPIAAELPGERFRRYPRAGASEATERSSPPRDPAGEPSRRGWSGRLGAPDRRQRRCLRVARPESLEHRFGCGPGIGGDVDGQEPSPRPGSPLSSQAGASGDTRVGRKGSSADNR